MTTDHASAVGADDHAFVGVATRPDDDECTYRNDGTDLTYCGRPRAAHETGPDPEDEAVRLAGVVGQAAWVARDELDAYYDGDPAKTAPSLAEAQQAVGLAAIAALTDEQAAARAASKGAPSRYAQDFVPCGNHGYDFSDDDCAWCWVTREQPVPAPGAQTQGSAAVIRLEVRLVRETDRGYEGPAEAGITVEDVRVLSHDVPADWAPLLAHEEANSGIDLGDVASAVYRPGDYLAQASPVSEPSHAAARRVVSDAGRLSEITARFVARRIDGVEADYVRDVGHLLGELERLGALAASSDEGPTS